MILYISGEKEKEYLKEVLQDFLSGPTNANNEKTERIQKILDRNDNYEKMQKRN